MLQVNKTAFSDQLKRNDTVGPLTSMIWLFANRQTVHVVCREHSPLLQKQKEVDLVKRKRNIIYYNFENKTEDLQPITYH